VQGQMDRVEAGRVRAMLGDLYTRITELSRKARLLDNVHRDLAALDPHRALEQLMKSEEFNQEVTETVSFGCFALALWGYYCPSCYLVLDPRRPWTGRCPECGGAVPEPVLEKVTEEEG